MKNENDRIDAWIPAEIFEFSADGAGSKFSDVDWQEAYFILDHAESKLTRDASRYTRADAVTGIWRAINHRIKILSEIYKFEIIFKDDRNLGLFEKFYKLGIGRSKLMKRLKDIRNSVDHDHMEPPSSDSCIEFAEYAWYFLKSTDHISDYIILDFELDGRFRNSETDASFTVKLGPENDWEGIITGRFLPEFLIFSKKEEWIHTTLIKSETRKFDGIDMIVMTSAISTENKFDFIRKYFAYM